MCAKSPDIALNPDIVGKFALDWPGPNQRQIVHDAVIAADIAELLS